MAERKLDVFNLLSRLDQKNLHIWETLSDEQRKEFSPYVVLKWLRGTTNTDQLMYLNELVNPIVFNLGDEKEFIMKMMAICTVGGSKRYQWIVSKANAKNLKLKAKIISDHEGIPLRKVKEIESLFSDADVMDMAEALGWQKDEITALKKELK